VLHIYNEVNGHCHLLPRVGVLVLDEILSCSNEVVKYVLLVLKHSSLVPAVTILTSGSMVNNILSHLVHTTEMMETQLVDSISSGIMCNARSSVETALSLPAVSPPADDPTLRPTPELGMVTRLPDKPGCYLRHEG